MALIGLPPEILRLILGHISIYELARFIHLHPKLYEAAQERLGGLIMIRLPQHEADKQRLLQRAKERKSPRFPSRLVYGPRSIVRELHFTPMTRESLPRGLNCFHDGDYDTGEDTVDQPTSTAALTSRLVNILRNTEDDCLRSFNWEMSACVPEELFGPTGYLTQHQRKIERVSLATSGHCRPGDHVSAQIDLSNLENLLELSWKKIFSAQDVDTLTMCLIAHAATLQRLELDIPNFHGIRQQQMRQRQATPAIPPLIQGPAAAQGLAIPGAQTVPAAGPIAPVPATLLNLPLPGQGRAFSFTDMLGIPPSITSPVFKSLSNLSLSNIRFDRHAPTDDFLHALDWNFLKVLRLRRCQNACFVLRRAIEMYLEIRLRTLEVVVHNPASLEEQHLREFLMSFTGLESLSLALPKAWWESVSGGVQNHQATLNNLVVHTPAPLPLPGTKWECDVERADVDWFGQTLLDLAWQNGHLEFIGTSQSPRSIIELYQDRLDRPQCEVLHLRRIGADMKKHHDLFNIEARNYKDMGTFERGFQTALQATPSLAQFNRTPDEVELEVILFANWAFGSAGLPKLRVLAYGDFGNGNMYSMFNILWHREHLREFPMRVNGTDREVDRWVGWYKKAVESCPSS